MVRTKIYPNKGSFEARISDKDFGVIRKVFKEKSDAERFCDEQRQNFEERRAKRTLGLSEKSFTPMPVDEAIKVTLRHIYIKNVMAKTRDTISFYSELFISFCMSRIFITAMRLR